MDRHNTRVLTCESKPSKINMMKKSMDHSGGAKGMEATAFGYAMNANPGPVEKKDVKFQDKDDILISSPKCHVRISFQKQNEERCHQEQIRDVPSLVIMPIVLFK